MVDRPFEELTSAHNPRVKQLIHLRERRERDQEGLFLIEGYRELLRAVDGLVAIDSAATFLWSFFLAQMNFLD